MSQELERVYTINLGKALISQSQHRAVRAINMIKEFARHHMKIEDIKIEEDLAHQIWSKGVRNPPRKIRVRMSKTDEGYVLVSPYDEEVEETSKNETKKDTKKEDKAESTKEIPVEDKVEPVKESAEDKAEPTKESPKKEPSTAPKKQTNKESAKPTKKAKPSKSK